MTQQKWQLIADLIIQNNCKVIIDLGISTGVTAKGISDLLIINNYIIDKYYGVDSFDDKECKLGPRYFAANEVQLNDLKSWYPFVFVNATTDDAAIELPNNIDLVFVDASHVPKQMIKDIVNYSAKLKDGGVLVGHEYGIFIKPVEYGDYGDITRFVDSYIGKDNINIMEDTRPESNYPCWLWWTYVYRNKDTGKIEYFKERKQDNA